MAKDMTVALLSRPHDPTMKGTGVQRYAFDLCRGLREHGIHVIHPAETSVGRMKVTRARAYGSPMGLIFVDILAPLECLVRHRSDLKEGGIVHIVDVLQGLLTPIICRFITKNVIVTMYDLGLYLHPNVAGKARVRDRVWQACFRLAMQVSARHSKVIAALSTQTAEEVIRVLGARNIAVLNPAIGDEFFSGPREQWGGGDRRIIGCVGALTPRKRLDKALRTFHYLKSITSVPCNLVISHPILRSGQEPLHRELEQLSSKLGVSNDVVFTSAFSGQDMPTQYASFDVLWHPSAYEGFGLPVIEAQANGLPVILWKDSILPAEVKAKALQAKDDEEAALFTHKLLTDAQFYARKSAESHAYSKNFSQEKMIRRVIEAYETTRGS